MQLLKTQNKKEAENYTKKKKGKLPKKDRLNKIINLHFNSYQNWKLQTDALVLNSNVQLID
jgi:hypothetical protein